MPLIIKIELPDESSCKGCPCLRLMDNSWYACSLFQSKLSCYPERPQSCIDRHKSAYKEIVGEVLEQFDRYNCGRCNKECPGCMEKIDCGEMELICRDKLLEAAIELEG